jgi:hypothetical protein
LNETVRDYFITDEALLNTLVTALVTVGEATAIAIAINASKIAYSTIVTPLCSFFFCINLAGRFALPDVSVNMSSEMLHVTSVALCRRAHTFLPVFFTLL